MKVALTLDSECRRVARAEQIEMADLMAEAAQLTGRSVREIYNYRSGKWSLPSDLIPIFCKRFGSYVLIDALREECREQRMPLPDKLDLVSLVAQTVRDDMQHYQFLIEAFESDGGIDAQELASLRRTGERVIQNVYHLLGVCEENCARREGQKAR
jgi:hypothetical protein